MTRPLLLVTLLASLPYALPASAAPLDALLQATERDPEASIEIEAAYDVVNDTVDVFDVRANDSEFGETNVGDYRGAHLRARWHFTDTLSLEGSLWQRRLDYRNDQAEIDSWQLGFQHRFIDAAGWRPAMAWRLSAWGNEADQLNKTSPTSVGGVTVDTVSVNSPQDRQAQLDLIASWPLTSRTSWSVFAGAGTSRVKLKEINGSLDLAGCPHQVTFQEARTIVAPTSTCGTSVRYDGAPIDTLGGDVYANASYKAKYLQAGTSLRWTGEQWQLAAAYQFQTLDRDNIDDRIEQNGRTVYDTNHTVIGEVRYRLGKNAQIFARAQAMEHQFVGEIPFAYNSFTSHRFDKRYGFVSAGLILRF